MRCLAVSRRGLVAGAFRPIAVTRSATKSKSYRPVSKHSAEGRHSPDVLDAGAALDASLDIAEIFGADEKLDSP
jgi:hypothetical protein